MENLAAGGMWGFHPSLGRDDIEQRKRFDMRLVSILAAARGLGLQLVIDWTTGPAAAVQIGSPSPHGRIWFRRILPRAYGPGQWVDVGTFLNPKTGGARRESSGSHSGLPIPDRTGDSPPWTDAVFNGLAGLPRGVTVEWTVVPIQGTTFGRDEPTPPPIEPRRIPVGFRIAPVTGPERDLRDRVERLSRSPGWAVKALIRSAGPESLVDVVARWIEAASRDHRSSSITFRKVRRVRSFGPEVFVTDDRGVGTLLPTPWSRLPALSAAGRVQDSSLEIGVTVEGDPIAIPWPERGGRHLLVLGETGMGKSSLLVRLALQAVKLHAAFVLFDPLGDTARAFVSRISSETASRVTWISPHLSPIGFNALRPGRSSNLTRGEGERTIGDLVSALRRVRIQRFPGTPFWGPRIEETLRLALEIAREFPDGTLVDAERLLQPEARLSGIVPPKTRFAVEELRARVRQRPEEVEGTRRLLGEITRNATLRRMLCEPSASWSPERAILPGAITVVSGDAAQVGETIARYLLAVHLALIWPSILARSTPSKLILALDEVQWYAHEGLSEILRLGRRFNVHVWAATQALHTLPEDTREAFLTNAADLVSFRGSPDEARELARWTSSVVAAELLALPAGWGIAMIGKGAQVETIRTSGIASKAESDLFFAKIIESSRRYVNDVETRADEPPDAPPTVSPVSSVKGAGTTGRVIAVLRAGSVAHQNRGLFRVRLSRLRAIVDPTGIGVRQAGPRLQQGHFLKSTDRSEGETWWTLDAEMLSRSATETDEVISPNEAARLWEAVDRNGPE